MSQKTYMYDTQWQALINAIDGGDTSAIATALGQIKTSIDAIETALGSLSADVTQDSTQWTNLINAITNQSLTVDLSNITSSAVANLSNVIGATVTDVINALNSTLTNNFDGVRFYNFIVGASANSIITINANSRLILFTSNTYASACGGNFITADGGGTVGVTNFAAASSVSITAVSANNCKITNNSNKELRCCAICMQGSLSA